MKLIKKWEDKYYGCTNYIYELPMGMKLVHVVDPKAVDTTIDAYFDGGAYFETIFGFKPGTAHFLEHMMCNPNHFLKTQTAMSNYRLGTEKFGSIYANAWTSKQKLDFRVITHSDNELRAMKYLVNRVKYPTELFEKNISKERDVILSERTHARELHEDEDFQYQKFLLSNNLAPFATNILGEVEDIKSITCDDLRAFNEIIISKNNGVVSIHSNRKISKRMEKFLNEIDTFVQSRAPINYKKPKELISNSTNIGYFKDNYENGFRIEYGYFRKKIKNNDYKNLALSKLTRGLIGKVAYLFLREKLGLIYDNGAGVYSAIWERVFEYASFKCQNDVKKKLIKKLKTFFNIEILKYLNSKDGAKWLLSQKSSNKFPFTTPYDDEYAYNIDSYILNKEEQYDKDKFVEAVLKIETKDIEKYYLEYLNTPKHIWIVSNLEEKEALKGLNL